MNARWDLVRGLVLDFGVLYTGHAWALGPDGTQVTLPTSWRLNTRLAAQRYFNRSGVFGQLFAGVNNLTDALNVPQLGLPDAGRTWRIGLSLSR